MANELSWEVDIKSFPNIKGGRFSNIKMYTPYINNLYQGIEASYDKDVLEVDAKSLIRAELTKKGIIWETEI